MRLLPSSDQITNDLDDINLRIAKMNARRNAQINLLQKKLAGGSLRSKYNPWSGEYQRRLYQTDHTLYPFRTYPWRSSSLDSLELDKYYDSLNLDSKSYFYEPEDDEFSDKYKRFAKVQYPSNTDLLSKLKDFVFEQERQITTDLLRKITADKKLRSSDRLNLFRPTRELKSLNRADDTPLKSTPPFLNPINKKDNFYKRYNAFIKKILRPLRKSSPVKYEPSKISRIPRTTTLSPIKTNYLSKSYLNDYYYPIRFYRPYWNRYYSSPLYHQYLHDYEYGPKLQPASVPQDVESIIRKSNNENRSFRPIKNNYVASTSTYKYDPFESDSYLRSSLPTWKQYYYTQKLKSKPSNECFLDYYDPYYDFFPDRASVDSTDDLLSNEEVSPEVSDDPNLLVDEYRDAIYEDIIQNLREKQTKKSKRPIRQTNSSSLGCRVNHRAENQRPGITSFNKDCSKNLYPTSNSYHVPENIYDSMGKMNSSRKYQTYGYYPKNNSTEISNDVYLKNNMKQKENFDYLESKSDPHINSISDVTGNDSKNTFDQPESYYRKKLEDNLGSNVVSINENPVNQRSNVVSPSIFHSKCTTPVDNSFNRNSFGNLSSSKTKNTTCSTDRKGSPKCVPECSMPEGKLEKYRSSIPPTKNRSHFTTLHDEDKSKYDLEPRRISEYNCRSTASPTKLANSDTENAVLDKHQNSPLKNQSVNTFTPITSAMKSRPSVLDLHQISNYPPENENMMSPNSITADNKFQLENSLTEKQLPTDENLADNKFQRLSSSSSIEARNRDMVRADVINNYPLEQPTQRILNSPIEKKRTQLSTSETVNDRKRVEERPNQPRKESSIDYSVPPETLQRSSAASRGKQSTPTTDKVTLSRRNSVISENNKSFPNQSASRRNSIKPVLQRKNSIIQPTVTEKRNLLYKMNYDTEYEGDKEQLEVANEYSVQTCSIDGHNETNITSHLYQQPETLQLQHKLSRDDMFFGTDEQAQKSFDYIKHDANTIGDKQAVYQYELNPNQVVNTNIRDTSVSGTHPDTSYYGENSISYDENTGDSYGTYNNKNVKELQPFYPEYNYAETKIYEDTNTRENYYPEQTYQRDPNYTNFGSYQNSYPSIESYPNNYAEYFDQSQPAPTNYVTQEYAPKSQHHYEQKSQRGSFDNYEDKNTPVFENQTSNESYSRPSFQQLEENVTEVGLTTNQSPERSYEPKEQEQSLNSINEETEKLDDKTSERINKDAVKVKQQSTESIIAATETTKPKRSVDLGKSSAPVKELSRRASRSTLLAQYSDDRKLKNQYSTGELQKRTSKPKIGESKLKRTASTIKGKPTAAKKS